jgi:hypothetical protein
VNNAWRALWRERLKDLNLESENKSIDTLIEKYLMQPFEDVIKKRTTLRPGDSGDYDDHLTFPGIEEDFSTHYLRDEKIRFIRQVQMRQNTWEGIADNTQGGLGDSV